MTVPTDTILRVVLSMLLPDSAIAQNVFYAIFKNDGGSDANQDVLDDLEAWMEAIYTELILNIVSEIDLTGMKTYFYDAGDDDWDELGVNFPTVSFGAGGDPLPNGIAALCHAPTTNPDVTGAKYFAGAAEGLTSDNDWEATPIANYVDAIQVWVDPFTGGLTGSEFIPGVWSVAKTAFFEMTTAGSLNGQVAYQRRRKPGVGI